MKYDKKYPYHDIDAEIEDGFIKSKYAQQCKNCGEQTKWLSIVFRGSCCSDDCNTDIWKKYTALLRLSKVKADEYFSNNI